MAWMEMDWILKKLANFFKFWCYVLQKSSRNLLWLALSETFDVFVVALQKHFVYVQSLKVMILAQNWPKTAKSSWHCSFNVKQIISNFIFTAPFNNMWTLKFKGRPTNAFYAAVNQMIGRSSQLTTTAEHCFVRLSELCSTIELITTRWAVIGS